MSTAVPAVVAIHKPRVTAGRIQSSMLANAPVGDAAAWRAAAM